MGTYGLTYSLYHPGGGSVDLGLDQVHVRSRGRHTPAIDTKKLYLH